jgi:hypothetical protein
MQNMTAILEEVGVHAEDYEFPFCVLKSFHAGVKQYVFFY